MFAMKDVPQAAKLLGLAGLIPFVGLAALAFAAPDTPAVQWLAAYAATILAFLGGCRWGLASAGMGDGPQLWPLLYAVSPSLWAWVALTSPAPLNLGLLAAGLAYLLVADLSLTRFGGAPKWWPALRAPLTLVAVPSLVAAMFA
ncbi:MAG: DUF3429 domain-containing protein [Rubrimonas sp.]|uniref:DUF3429 domain-containing protein n=1 Tax=Rubrimonas sp. TaxID=2036015 RepID=UPI002FDDD091